MQCAPGSNTEHELRKPMKIQLGDAVVTSIYERDLDNVPFIIPDAQPEALTELAWLRPHYVDAAGEPLGVVQAFVIQTVGHVVLVDCCIGDCKDITVIEAWAHSRTGFLDRLRAAGFEPGQIDLVLCTHMHPDHVGWNTSWTDEGWRPTFPNARYLFARSEFEHWQKVILTPVPTPDEQADVVEHALAQFHQTQINVFAQSIRPIVAAGLVDLVDLPTEVVAGVSLVPTPGHTPGHLSIRVQSVGEEALISGDTFHHPCQIARPGWASLSDDDPDQSIATRRELLADLADMPITFIGTHFAPPCHGRIISDRVGGYRFQPAPEDDH
jgi:glyoxylase-like metal-dependent hydrolase (beta-lactamase superfamily II)